MAGSGPLAWPPVAQSGARTRHVGHQSISSIVFGNLEIASCLSGPPSGIGYGFEDQFVSRLRIAGAVQAFRLQEVRNAAGGRAQWMANLGSSPSIKLGRDFPDASSCRWSTSSSQFITGSLCGRTPQSGPAVRLVARGHLLPGAGVAGSQDAKLEMGQYAADPRQRLKRCGDAFVPVLD